MHSTIGEVTVDFYSNSARGRLPAHSPHHPVRRKFFTRAPNFEARRYYAAPLLGPECRIPGSGRSVCLRQAMDDHVPCVEHRLGKLSLTITWFQPWRSASVSPCQDRISSARQLTNCASSLVIALLTMAATMLAKACQRGLDQE